METERKRRLGNVKEVIGTGLTHSVLKNGGVRLESLDEHISK